MIKELVLKQGEEIDNNLSILNIFLSEPALTSKLKPSHE